MPVTNYNFGSYNKDIIVIEHYHEAATLAPILKRFVQFAEERNSKIRALLLALEQEEEPAQKQKLLTELSSFQESNEQDIALFKTMLD